MQTTLDLRVGIPVPVHTHDVRDAWHELDVEARAERFRSMPHPDAADVFLALPTHEQAELILQLPQNERKLWLRLLPPDDAADLIQEVDPAEKDGLLAQLDPQTSLEVAGLLRYAEDAAGGLMNPRFSTLQPGMTVEEALSYLRRRAREQKETTYYVYVVDGDRLVGVASIRSLLAAQKGTLVAAVMDTDVVSVPDDMDQERVSQVFAETDLLAVPVVDAEGRIKGIVTVDDIVHVVREEATEDAQKYGGMEALEVPYLETGLGEMIRKRAGWLAILFFGELLTASAMGFFEHEIQRVVVLALFIPLIISSGGNSGSQASTLVIRAMALGEVRFRDLWRVLRREIASGLALGSVLGTLGVVRIVGAQWLFGSYGDHALRLGITVGASLMGVVLFGTLAGSMLPFALRRLGLDPASASAPFVATLVDVTGLVIYFVTASVVLRGTLL